MRLCHSSLVPCASAHRRPIHIIQFRLLAPVPGDAEQEDTAETGQSLLEATCGSLLLHSGIAYCV